MEAIDALAQTFDHAAKIVAGIGPAQFGAATPCRDWNLQQLLQHTFGVVHGIGCGVRGEELTDMNAFALAADLDAQFREESQRTLAAWRATDAAAEVDIGAGPMPAGVAIGINLLDTATHSWDIARASGQDGELPAELAKHVLGVCRGIVSDDIRQFAGFDAAAEPAAGATPTEQLVAFLGRVV